MPIQFVAQSKLPTRHGHFDLYAFEDPITKKEHLMIAKGLPVMTDLADLPVMVRIHSECLTGDAFGSLRCECGPQLNATFEMIENAGVGAILYLRQEGRGIGIVNKVRAYALQDQGHDTLDANLLLGLPADARTYEMTKVMLDHVGIKNVQLITNNPLKIEALTDLGINITSRIPLHVGENPYNVGYLATKQQRMRHRSDADSKTEVDFIAPIDVL